jgi:hypothetical protein
LRAIRPHFSPIRAVTQKLACWPRGRVIFRLFADSSLALDWQNDAQSLASFRRRCLVFHRAHLHCRTGSGKPISRERNEFPASQFPASQFPARRQILARWRQSTRCRGGRERSQVGGRERTQAAGSQYRFVRSILNVAGRAFACRTVAYAHGTHGRAYFTIALEDPADHNHIISFSGENGRRPNQTLYELPIDRMLLNSKQRPKVDGLPVPLVESSAGMCTQLGNFAQGQVSSIACSATDKNGRQYELRFESDGLPITLRRVRPGPPTIRQPS